MAGHGCGSDKVQGGDQDAGGGGDGGSSSGDAGNGNTTQGDNEDGGGVGGGTASDPMCDMNGIWIARQVTSSVALSLPQYANNYYYMELRQDGDDVVVTRSVDCGIVVRGSATVILTPNTAKVFMKHNDKAGRRGTFKPAAAGSCDFEMERYWNVRGADEARFAPSPRNSKQSIAELEAANPLPAKEAPDGAEDWDADGKLGVAWQITGNLTGTRNSVQRDWIEWFSVDEHRVTAAADFTTDLVVRAAFDAQENIFDASNPLVNTGSTTDTTAKHKTTLRFLGRSAADPRAKTIIKADPFETCLAVQDALPPQNSL
jgi:hypothetical protein